MSPLALVTHAAANNPQAAAAAAVAHHHRLIGGPPFGQMPNLMTHEIEQRMIEYLKLIQVKKEQNAAAAAMALGGNGGGTASMTLSPYQHQHQQQQMQDNNQKQQPTCPAEQNAEVSTQEAFNALEISRVALWQMYHNTNSSPPNSSIASPYGLGNGIESHDLDIRR